MSEETFDPEEDGFTFSDEDFGRRCFPEQKPHSVADLKNISRRANQQAHSNIVRYSAAATHSCARCAVVSPRLRRTDQSNRAAQALSEQDRTGSLSRSDINA
jgi:hypothetical protein